MPTTDNPSQTEDEVREEYFESHAMGVEIEVEDPPPTDEPEPGPRVRRTLCSVSQSDPHLRAGGPSAAFRISG